MRLTGAVVIERGWAEFKKLLDGVEKKLVQQHEENSRFYEIVAIDDQIVYRCEIFKATHEPETWAQADKDANAADRADFETNWKTGSNKPLRKKDAAGTPLASFPSPQLIYERPVNVGDRLWVFSHNLCDKSTWYADAIRVVNESAGTGDGVLKEFLLGHPFVVDVVHGKISDEDKLVPSASQGGSTYKLVVRKDGVALKERRFDYLPPGPSSSSSSSGPWSEREALCDTQHRRPTDNEADYEVDYHLGLLTFYQPVEDGAVLTADYFYSPLGGGSAIYVQPPAGKTFVLTDVETQFSKDLDQIDTVEAGVFMYIPQYGAPPAKFLVPTSHTKFKRFRDLVNWARGAFPVIPPLGGPVRGLQYDTIQLRFEYQSPIELYPAYGMELRFWLSNHRPLKGEYASITVYGLMVDS